MVTYALCVRKVGEKNARAGLFFFLRSGFCIPRIRSTGAAFLSMGCTVVGECSQPMAPTSKGSVLAGCRLAFASVVLLGPLVTLGRRILERECALIHGQESIELAVWLEPAFRRRR